MIEGWAHDWCTDEIRPWLVDGPMGHDPSLAWSHHKSGKIIMHLWDMYGMSM